MNRTLATATGAIVVMLLAFAAVPTQAQIHERPVHVQTPDGTCAVAGAATINAGCTLWNTLLSGAVVFNLATAFLAEGFGVAVGGILGYTAILRDAELCPSGAYISSAFYGDCALGGGPTANAEVGPNVATDVCPIDWEFLGATLAATSDTSGVLTPGAFAAPFGGWTTPVFFIEAPSILSPIYYNTYMAAAGAGVCTSGVAVVTTAAISDLSTFRGLNL